MAERIKGISFVLGLDVSEFKANLKDVTDALKLAKQNVQQFKSYLESNPGDQNAYKGYIEALKKLKEMCANTKTDFKKLAEELLKSDQIDDGRFEQVVKDLKLLDGYLKTSIPNFDKLNDRIKTTADGTYYLADSLEESNEASQGFKDTMWGTFVSGVLEKAVSAVVSLVKELASAMIELFKSGVSYNIEMEKYTVAINAMLNGDQQAADSLISSMKELGSSTSFDTSTLLEASQMLLAADVNAEDTTETIKGLASALAYAGKGNDELSRMAQNLQQIKNNAKASATDLKQFSNAGVNVLGLISEMTGIATDELQEQGVTFEQISEALISASESGGKFENALAVQASTINGQIEMLKSNFTQLEGVIANDLTDSIKNDYLPVLNEAISKMKEFFEASDIQGVAETFVGSEKELVEQLSESIIGVVSKSKEYAIAFWNAFLDIGEDGHSSLYNIVRTITDTITSLLSDYLIDYLASGEMLQVELEIASKIASAIFDGLVNGIVNLIGKLAQKIGDYLGTIGSFLGLNNNGLSNYDISSGIHLNSGSLGLQSGGLTVNTSINVNNNGTPISEREIRRWGNTITDIVSSNLGRRM